MVVAGGRVVVKPNTLRVGFARVLCRCQVGNNPLRRELVRLFHGVPALEAVPLAELGPFRFYIAYSKVALEYF